MSAHRATPRSRAGALATLAAVATLVLVGACGSPAAPGPTPEAGGALAAGRSVRAVTVDGTRRTYRVFRPERLADAAPLVLVFHGYGGDAEEIERGTGWADQAESAGAVVVFPEGVDRSFNAGGCCGEADSKGVDDVAAALAMIDDVAKAVPIDADRVYSTGFSNGGFMSYRLACETDRFAAIAPVAGSRLVACDSPRPTSLLHIHGLADRRVPAAGETRDGVVVPPADQVVAAWRRALACGPATESTAPGAQVRRTSARCPDGRAVDLVTLASLGHTWPRSSDGLDATSHIWEFFAAHRR